MRIEMMGFLGTWSMTVEMAISTSISQPLNSIPTSSRPLSHSASSGAIKDTNDTECSHYMGHAN